MNNKFFGIAFFLIVFTQTPGACGDQATIDMSKIFSNAALGTNFDVGVKAASQTSEKDKKIAEANRAEAAAFSEANFAKGAAMDFGPIDKAIELQGGDMQLHNKKAVMLVMAGKDPKTSIGNGVHALVKDNDKRNPGIYTPDQLSDSFTTQYAFTLRDVGRFNIPADQKKNLDAELCRQLRLMEKRAKMPETDMAKAMKRPNSFESEILTPAALAKCPPVPA